MNKSNTVLVLITMMAVSWGTVMTFLNITPDRMEPVIKDSLVYGHVGCFSCTETGRKKVVVYNKAGQVICAYYDTMTTADYQLYNHSKIPDETTENQVPDLGTGQ